MAGGGPISLIRATRKSGRVEGRCFCGWRRNRDMERWLAEGGYRVVRVPRKARGPRLTYDLAVLPLAVVECAGGGEINHFAPAVGLAVLVCTDIRVII